MQTGVVEVVGWARADGAVEYPRRACKAGVGWMHSMRGHEKHEGSAQTHDHMHVITV